MARPRIDTSIPPALTGAQIRTRRLALGLATAQLARLASVSTAILVDYEGGRRNMHRDQIARVATVLSILMDAHRQIAERVTLNGLLALAADLAAESSTAQKGTARL